MTLNFDLDKAFTLGDYASAVKPDASDRFVGLRIRKSGPELIFPLGFNVPESESELKSDARRLLQLLSRFDHERGFDVENADSKTLLPENSFILRSYMLLIEDYLSSGRLLSESDSHFLDSAVGQVDWPRTIASNRPSISDGNVVYLNLVSRRRYSRPDSLVKNAHELALSISFHFVGWMYPENPFSRIPARRASNGTILAVKRRIQNTFDDRELRLLQAIHAVLTYSASDEFGAPQVFGTNAFESIWEFLVERAFGNIFDMKLKYFPRSSWLLNGHVKHTNPLLPDTIMLHDESTFILDAKYYRYGASRNPRHLPGNSDIAKQVVYGEHAASVHDFRNQGEIYNAFLMPGEVNSENNKWCEVVGVSSVSWVPNPKRHQVIVLVVIDVRFLFRKYSSHGLTLKTELANCIVDFFNSDSELRTL